MTELDRLADALAGRYRVERELGRGGMATVYLAQDLKHGRRVAIKVMRPEVAESLGADRFVREIEILAGLSHPHILPLFDSGEASGLLYYVMPYVEGESLRQRLERDVRFTPADAIRIAAQVASALGYAHEHGIIHRDIKPENILMNGDQAVVADFGIARAVEAASDTRLTRTGVALGTACYMSPEQALGGAADARSDVYALGCVVFEMVSGRVPFEGPTVMLPARRLQAGAPSLRRESRDVPLFLDRAVARAMDVDPDDRFQTAEAFAAALASGRVRSRLRRRHFRRALAGVAGAALLGLAGWGISAARAPRMERLAILPLADLTGDPEQAYLAPGVHEALINELGRLGLSITARATMAKYRDTDKSIADIARELGVDGVIEGSVYRDGDSLQIAARLYRRDERELWAGSFAGVMPNIVGLYHGFARAIAGEVRLSLSPAAEARLTESRQVNPEVYEAYLQGMHVLHGRTTRADAAQAIALFERAIERNPVDPLAYAGLAQCYVTLGHGEDSPPGVWRLARAAAERAIRLDSTSAEGWAALADYKTYFEHDWEGAERAFRRTNELNPSLAMNHYHYSWFLVMFGRVDEAVREHRRAQELDPLTPIHFTWAPALHWFDGNYERAWAEAEPLLGKYPNGVVLHYVLGETAYRLGRVAEAIAYHERLAEISPAWSCYLGQTYARAGRRADALRILRQVEAEPITSWNALCLAHIHRALGNRDEALRWIAYDDPHAWLAGMATSMYDWESYLDDPRYQAVVRRLNLRYGPGDRAPTPLPPQRAELPSVAAPD
jgi:eukaryotic-like serine/threonine-protein kinase